jgi:hypothetical protein
MTIRGGFAPDTEVRLPEQDELSSLSKSDLESLIARICSPHGTVVRVVIHPASTHPKVRAFALVDMSDVTGAKRLAIAFNRPRIGVAVLLPL